MEPVTTKVCKRCGTEKSLSEYYVRKERNNEPYSKCKECLNSEQDQKKFAKLSPEKQQQILQHRKQQAYLAEGKKECGRCKEVKPVTDYMTKAGKINYAHCSICRPQTDKEYFAKNPEKQSNRHATIYKHRDLVAAYTLPLKEAGCADCQGYYPDAMEFDHTCHPSEKFSDIARINSTKGSSENIMKMLEVELAKGEYVCVNCHKIRTMRRADSSRIKYLSNTNSDWVGSTAKYVYDVLSKASCVDCQEDNFLGLEFDHVRGSKTANISMMIKKPTTFSLDIIIEEIAKCEIRCGNCHRIRTRARQIGKETTLQSPKNNNLKICKCGNKKTLDALVCIKCRNKNKTLLTLDRYGDLDTLLSRLAAANFTQIGKELGVSGNAVKKYIQRRGIDPKTLLPMMTDEGNENR